MKRYILILLILFELVTIPIPKYVELNNLAIIEEIAVIEENARYTVILKEIIPIKDDQGISYKYKYYKQTSASIKKAYQTLLNTTKKKLYLKRTKSLITNSLSSKEALTILKINPSTIYHSNKDLEKLIKSS